MTSGCCDNKPRESHASPQAGSGEESRATDRKDKQASCCGDRAAKIAEPASTRCGADEPTAERTSAPCCGTEAPRNRPRYRRVPVGGLLSTLAGDVPKVSTRWSLGDRAGRVLVRLGLRRMSYAIAPGLYAVGRPGPDAPVLVSANYKLSFDVLRRAIDGLDAWILVLDTRGVNVWCAAGKGTFDTAEVARQVEATRLAQVVRHRRLIVPQLGAPSVAAHEVERLTDFGVVFGPVRASDIPAFLARGLAATPEMRRVRFDLGDRVEVAWLELFEAGRAAALLSLVALAAAAWDGTGPSWAAAWAASTPVLLALWSGVLAGTVLFAAVLPWLPGRMFAVKGAVLGAVLAAGTGFAGRNLLPAEASAALPVSLALLTVAVTSYLATNYTGCTTFTSLSGVRRELRLAIPAMAAALVVAAAAPLAAVFLGGFVR